MMNIADVSSINDANANESTYVLAERMQAK